MWTAFLFALPPLLMLLFLVYVICKKCPGQDHDDENGGVHRPVQVLETGTDWPTTEEGIDTGGESEWESYRLDDDMLILPPGAVDRTCNAEDGNGHCGRKPDLSVIFNSSGGGNDWRGDSSCDGGGETGGGTGGGNNDSGGGGDYGGGSDSGGGGCDDGGGGGDSGGGGGGSDD